MKYFKLLNKSSKYLLICIIITSCKPNFDILELELNQTKINDIVNKNIELEDESMGGKTFKITSSEKMLIINNLQLKNQNLDSTRSNHLWIEYDKKDSIINAYQLVYYTQIGDPKVVFEKLKERMGEPDFRHFPIYSHSFEESESNNFDAALWEDKENKIFYMLQYTLWDDTIRELRLYALNNNELNLEDPTFHIKPFYFWKDYLDAREEMDKPNFTYQEFRKNQGGKYRDFTK